MCYFNDMVSTQLYITVKQTTIQCFEGAIMCYFNDMVITELYITVKQLYRAIKEL